MGLDEQFDDYDIVLYKNGKEICKLKSISITSLNHSMSLESGMISEVSGTFVYDTLPTVAIVEEAPPDSKPYITCNNPISKEPTLLTQSPYSSYEEAFKLLEE